MFKCLRYRPARMVNMHYFDTYIREYRLLNDTGIRGLILEGTGIKGYRFRGYRY